MMKADKTQTNKTYLVTAEHCHGEDLGHRKPTISCPGCGKKMIAFDLNYCQKCGSRLKIVHALLKWIDSYK